MRPVRVEGAGKVKLFGAFTTPETTKHRACPPSRWCPRRRWRPERGARHDRGGRPARPRPGRTSARAGLATYRYDQGGTGQRRVEPDVRLWVDDLVADGRAARDVPAQRRDIAGREPAVVAYDQGGLVALRLAAPTNGSSGWCSSPRSRVSPARPGERLLATRTVPALDATRTELRPLVPAHEADFLADLYAMDPAAEAAKVKAPALIVVPADPAPYEPQRLAAAIPGAQVGPSVGSGTTLVISGRRPRTSPTP